MMDEYKRPRSPIERIKSLFKKSKDNINLGLNTNTTRNNFEPTAVSTRYNQDKNYNQTIDKIFGSYPSSNQSSIGASSYYKRYGGFKY